MRVCMYVLARFAEDATGRKMKIYVRCEWIDDKNRYMLFSSLGCGRCFDYTLRSPCLGRRGNVHGFGHTT